VTSSAARAWCGSTAARAAANEAAATAPSASAAPAVFKDAPGPNAVAGASTISACAAGSRTWPPRPARTKTWSAWRAGSVRESPTNASAPAAYDGAAFRAQGGQLVQAWVLGDLADLWRQLTESQ
jgi:hypothetical protein